MRRFLPLLALVVVGPPAIAQEKLPDGAKVAWLEVFPAKLTLTGPFAYAQPLVTAHLEGGEAIDATRLANVGGTVSGVVQGTPPSGQIRPVTDGAGNIVYTLGGKSVTLPVTVGGFKAEPPVSFVKDVQPVLSKLGCNAGTCHGAQAGKNGFKLSLRGYDPIYDFRALTDDLEGRRFNRADPDRSLMLLKPAGAVPHAGGVLFGPTDPGYEMIRRWIAQGVKLDLDAPRVSAIAVTPMNPVVARIGGKQQFAVTATYTDGSTRDVTAEAFVESSNTEVATVDKTGLVTTVRRGESTMLVRYEGAYAASTVVVMGDRSGFEWVQRPVHNPIDELVDAKLQKMRIQASPVCDDPTFVRRVYLDLTGLPPTADETKTFLDDPRDGRVKRDALIDSLVGSEAFVEHWTNKWCDLLQVNRKFLGDPGAKAFRAWVRNAVATNMPYDKFAYEILTASGSNVENPPAAYYKVLRTPDAVMENTTQLFLAVRFNCNKCHDHPFEKWTQDQYYTTAAYFAQVTRAEDPKYKGQKLGGTAVEGGKPLVEVIADGKTGDVKHDRTGEVSAPKFPYPVPGFAAGDADSRRVQLAKWATAPANPYFARSYANRLWAYLVGVGVIEPIDDIRAGNPATNPELLDRLTADFVGSGFDTRSLIKTVCKSRTYQLAISTNKWNKDDEINYSHAVARRLPAEVLYDGIHRVTGSLSKLPGLPPGSRAALLPDSNVELPGGFLELFGKPARESACECERSGGMNLGPVLAMVNGPVVGEAIRDPNNGIARIMAEEADDAKAVARVYLAVLSRYPTAAETAAGVKALNAAGTDFTALVADHQKKQAAFAAYVATLDDKQKAYEAGLRAQKPTDWRTLDVYRAESKFPANKPGATLTLRKDGSILASGPTDAVDIYTVTGNYDAADKPVTAVRLEVLADPSLPGQGPGRAENGNFVLNEFKLGVRGLDKPEDAFKPVKLTGAVATFEQNGLPAGYAIDGNLATGWAVSPQVGKDHAALFRFQPPVPAGGAGLAFQATLEQRYGANHVVGRFRLSVTSDPNPKLASPLTADQIALLDTPFDRRTDAQRKKSRDAYLAQDKEYQRLAAEAAVTPPAAARVVGAQDLAWALINSPAFLFNH